MFGELILLGIGLVHSGARIISTRPGGGGPGSGVVLFHGRLGAGDLADVEEVFSFRAAYAYWKDITASLGIAPGTVDEFRGILEGIFSQERVRAEAASYRPGDIRSKVVGEVASVVFTKEMAGGEGEPAVATVVKEDGRWKVRTYPGVFPGELLGQAKRRAGEAHERGREAR
jgi:hypothetical protein